MQHLALLVHGMAGNSSMWRHVMPSPAEHFTVVASDLPGQPPRDRATTRWALSLTARGSPDRHGRIVKQSRKSSLYTIHVKFTDSAGNGAGDGLAVVAKVDAGATVNCHANGSLNAEGPVKCACPR